MRLRNYILGLLSILVLVANGQNTDPLDTILNMQVDLFDHQDELGQALNVFLIEFEAKGHLGNEEDGYTDRKTIEGYVSLFDADASVPDDISQPDSIGGRIAISKYGKKANGKKYFAYSLIVEKKLIKATRVDSGRYKGTYKYFKLYNEQAVIGKAYALGAIYMMELEFNRNGSGIQINSIIKQEENGEFRVFELGNFGYTSNNNIKASNNLQSLIKEPSEFAKLKFAPPKDSSLYRVGPSVMVSGSYILPNYFNPLAYFGNINSEVPASSNQSGWKAGVKIILPNGKEGNFNFTIGLAYESNSYDMIYEDLSFIYQTDCFGDRLLDLEGTEYDEKYVNVSSYKENGSLAFLQPEAGVLYHINFGEKMKLSLFGNVGFSYLTNSSYNSETIVSYSGKKLGLGVVDHEELGFYQDYNKKIDGEISNAISFYKLGYGGSLDFSLGEKNRSWLSINFEMNQGLSPIFDTGYEFCPFLDVDVNDTFLSTFTNTQKQLQYNSMAIGVSYRYQFPKR
jgi:hypothetical protein